MRNQPKTWCRGVSFTAAGIHAEISGTTATVRLDNSLVIDIRVTTAGAAVKLVVTYQTDGLEPLVTRWAPVLTTGGTTITIGRLRAARLGSILCGNNLAAAPLSAPAGTLPTVDSHTSELYNFW
jgi:hypothetical protein